MNVIVKEYEFNKSLIHRIDSLIDNWVRDCHKKHFHKFDLTCVFDINLKNIRKKTEYLF